MKTHVDVGLLGQTAEHQQDFMTETAIRDEGQSMPTPRGKVLGVVETRERLNEIVAALAQAGFDKITTLHGDDGVHLLERVDDFFWGDAEGPILQRHIEELKAGNFIMSVVTPSDRAEEVADIAAAHGARFLVHFGMLSNTWLKK